MRSPRARGSVAHKPGVFPRPGPPTSAWPLTSRAARTHPPELALALDPSIGATLRPNWHPCCAWCTIRAMGRIFEVRKHTMFARWNRMAKQFARIAKDITMAVKSGGPDPSSNPSLRRVIQNARAVNMPKDKVEAAIKRASGRDAANYHEVIYEGYAPHGVPIIVECATDNTTRTVATNHDKGRRKACPSSFQARIHRVRHRCRRKRRRPHPTSGCADRLRRSSTIQQPRLPTTLRHPQTCRRRRTVVRRVACLGQGSEFH